MDQMIQHFDAVEDDDLRLCPARGIAYQLDMAHRVAYDAAYFDKCRGYENAAIARKINIGRVNLVAKYIGDAQVLDVGIGSGEFIRKRARNTLGYDLNPKAVEWLKSKKLWAVTLGGFDGYTFWDVLEHIEDPNDYFKHMAAGAHLFTSLPIFDDLTKIRSSKHYRPGEHLYYWTKQGFVDYMALYRFRLLEVQTFETDAGRESIKSFAFVRDLPGYHDTLAQYRKLHENFYGTSAWLYLDAIAAQVLALGPQSILDYGCGRSDLVAHFWADGARQLAKYDAAINTYQAMPEGVFDLVICCDVMEHILMRDVDQILNEIRNKSPNALFTISLRPARKHLPDGRNAHVTLLTEAEWLRWISKWFDHAVKVPTQWDHILMVRTWGGADPSSGVK